MRQIKNVIGCEDSARPVIVTPHVVYVNTNITPVETGDGCKLYKYDQYQYTKDEYIEVQARTIETLNEQVTTTQLAIVELYEIQAAMQQQQKQN